MKHAGGNMIPGAVAVTLDTADSVLYRLQRMMPGPTSIVIYPIGSAGKKKFSTDLDVMIDAEQLIKYFGSKDLTQSKKDLEAYFHRHGFLSSRSGMCVHVGIPVDYGSYIVQVDIMVVKDAKSVVPLHTHDYSNDPNMKGGTLHAIWADLANMSTCPGHLMLKLSPFRGLVNRKSQQLITFDKDEIAKIIIGPGACANDMRSISAILSALKPYPEKYQAVQMKYSPDVGFKTTAARFFRRVMDYIK